MNAPNPSTCANVEKLHSEHLWEATPARRKLVLEAFPNETNQTRETFRYFFRYNLNDTAFAGSWQLVERTPILPPDSKELASRLPKWIRFWKARHRREQERSRLYSLVGNLSNARKMNRFDQALIFQAEQAIVKLAKIGTPELRAEYGLVRAKKGAAK